ncbi:LamG-like jellyroll fold domain-containing protein [Kitasatospora sp. KL5]|uniref:LamG-like jellyroll fold domain-containing protein n=1 Tax=Kitasatospora sp. KL5 TaxID=3425125 RepID=UPI003D6EEE18
MRLQLAPGASVAYSLQGASPVDGTASGSAVTYKDVRPQADLEIIAGSDSFKETLLLRDATAPTEWLFPLSLNGVKASLNAQGDVLFTDWAGTVLGRMPKGWMQDSAFAPNTEEGANSSGVTYELLGSGADQVLKVKLDADWLHAPERVFPVRVDPSVISVKSTESTYVQSGYTNDYSTDTILKAGTYDGGSHKAISFIKFPGVENTLKNATVVSARLALYNSWSYSCNARPVTIHPITSGWSASSVRSWPGPSIGNALVSPSFAHGYRPTGTTNWSCAPAWESISLGNDGKNLVNAWTHGWAANNGLAVKADDRDSYGWKNFGSKNYPNGVPSLDITWSKYGADYELQGWQQPVTATQEGIYRIRVWNRGQETWTPTNSYKMSYLLYDQAGNNITNYGTNIAWTAMPNDVPPGGSAVVDARIRTLPQGTYTLAWTMDDYQHSNFAADTGIAPKTIQFSSVNMLPYLTALAPASNSITSLLQPTLTADAADPDRLPNPVLDYRFEVCRVAGQDARVDCKQSAWLKGQRTFVVPDGWMTWNQQYAWYVEAGDGAGASPKSQPSYLRPTVPQPTQYTGPADKGRDFSASVGNYATAATDAALPTVGPELSVTRSYNSLDPRTSGAFGAGWTSRWDMRIEVESSTWLSLPGNVVVTSDNGTRTRFAWDAAKSTYISGGGVTADLRKASGGGWTLTDRNATVHVFDAAGRLVKITDGAGRIQEITYANGRIAQAKDTLSGRYLDFTWNGAHVASVTASGATGAWNYLYDGDRLTKVCPPGVATTASTGCTVYEYGTGSRYRTAVQDAGPVAYWRLGDTEGSATVANDARVDRTPGKAYDVTWNSSGATTGSGSGSAVFDGTATSYIELPARTISSSPSRSVELWFKTAGPGVILSHQNTAITQDPWLYTPNLYVAADGKLRGEFWQGAGTPITSATPVNDNTWHHVVLSAAVNTQALFLDGVQVGTLTGTVDHLGEDFTYLGAGKVTGWPAAAGTPNRFTGQIDEVAVYDYPLTEKTAAEHYALRTGTTQLAKVTLPSGRTSAQVGYNPVTERITTVTDAAGQPWKLSEPSYTGGSFLYRNAVLANSPAAYWRLGEQDGAVAASEAGTGTAAGYGETALLRAPGVFAPTDDTAVQLAGTSQVELPDEVLHASPDVAVELWFSTTKPGVLLGDQERAIDDAAGVGGAYAPVLYVGADGKLRGHFYTGSGSGTAAGPVSAAAVTDAAWHHVVLSVQGATQTLYLDGAAIGTFPGAPNYQGAVHTYLGAGFAKNWTQAPADLSRFTGTIDEAAVYQHPLSAGDVLAHYRARSAQVAGQGIGYRGSVVADSPAAFWRLDETTGATVFSEVAANNGNGTYANGAQRGAPGVFGAGDGQAAAFTGATDSLAEVPEGILHASKDLAVELWFKSTKPGVILGDQSLKIDDPAGPGGTWTPVLYVGSDNKLWGRYWGAAGSISSPAAVTDGAWHHVVLSAAGTQQTLYLDGALVGTQTGAVNHASNVHTYFGAGFAKGWPSAPADVSRFTGSIDEVAFYQHPLGADRVAAHFQARSVSSATMLASRVTVTDPSGTTSTDVHDATRGMRLISRTNPAGGTTTYSYDTGGFVHTVTDPNGHSTVTGQDARGNTISTTTCRDSNSCWTSYTGYYLDPNNPTDPRNDKPTELRDSRSSGPGDNRYRTTIAYNTRGQVESTTLPDGRVTRTTYTAGTEPAAGGGTTPAGLVATHTTPGGVVTSYSYRASGDTAQTTAPSGLRTVYDYDPMGRKISETQYADTQPAGVKTTFAYDALSRPTEETGPRITDVVSGASHQAKITRQYDEDGRLLSTATADIAGTDTTRTATSAYDSAGRLETTTDAEGGQIRYGYDALSRTSSVTDELGRITRFTYTPLGQPATTVVEGWDGDGQAPRDLTVESRAYDPAGRLASVTDAMGATTAYRYYDDGLLASTTAQAVTQADGSTHPVVLTSSEYDGAGHLTKQITGGGRTTTAFTVDTTGRTTATVLDPGGLNRTSTLGYDADDRITSTTLKVSDTENSVQTATYDTAGNITRSETSSSKGGPTAVATFRYDQRGLMTEATSPNGNAQGADPAAHTTTYTYDELGHLTATSAPQVATEANGQPAQNIHPVTAAGYNTFGELVTARDANGAVTTRTLNRLGRVTEVKLPDYTPPGAATPLTAVARTEYDKRSRTTALFDAAGRKTTFGYDRLDHQTTRTDPNTLGYLQPPVYDSASVWSSTWTPTGLQLSATDPTGARTEATYDQLGRPLTDTVVERKPSLQNLTTRHTWDDAGNQTAATTPVGSTSSATFNAAGQPVTTTDPAGRVTRIDYDGLGRPTKTTEPLGEAATIAYDALGNPASTSDLDPAGTVLRTVSATFDLEGHQLTGTSASGNVTSTAYNALGQIVRLVEPVAAGTSITTSFGYDTLGHRTRLTDGKGNTTTYTFTPWGLPESTIEPATAAHPLAADRTWTTTYDVTGQAVKVTEPGNVVRTSSYDPMGRLTKETGTGAEASTQDRTLRYDKAGRITSANGAGVSSQDFTYNDRGLPIGATVSGVPQEWAYDKEGRMIDRWDSVTGWASYGYKADGQLDWSEDQLTGSQFWYGYDGNGRLKTQYYVSADAATPDGWKVTSGRYLAYDALGRLNSDRVVKEDTEGTPVTGTAYEYDLDDRLTRKTITGKPGDPTTDNRYTYDQANRLTSWTIGTATTTYEWDAAGNRTKNGTAVATYDQRNRLLSDGTSTYRYTPRGTLAGTTTGGTEQTEQFDAFGRLVNDGSTTYTYDGLDRLILRGSTSLSYDGGTNNVISDGTWRYARDASGTVTGAADANGAKRVRTDRHTDVTATLNTAGTAVGSSTTYDPFGKPVASTGSSTSLGYQSGWTDPATGQVNMHARWYQPGTGAFTSRDSWQLDPDPSIQANRYTYGNGDPMDGVDPTGHAVLAPERYQAKPANMTPAIRGVSFGLRWGKRLNPLFGALDIGTDYAADYFIPNLNTTRAFNKVYPTIEFNGRPTGKNMYYGYVHQGSGLGTAMAPEDSPQTATTPGGGRGGGSGGGGGRSGGSTKPPKPIIPQNPNRGPKPVPAPDRPVPLPDWLGPWSWALDGPIDALYGSAELQSMLAAGQNVTPDQAQIPQTHGAPGANPGSSTKSGQPRSCLDRRPATAEDDSKDGTMGSGWIDYWNMENVAGSPGVQRPTGAEACLTGKPSAKRGTGAQGDITGWAEAETLARNAGATISGSVTPLARCHFIAREFGGRGKAENLAPCFQVGVNTTKEAMRGFEVIVGKAMNNNQIVDYSVIPIYKNPASKIPLGFSMMAYGQYPDGSPGLMAFRYVPNEKVIGGTLVKLGQ